MARKLSKHEAETHKQAGRFLTGSSVFRLTQAGNSASSNLSVGMYRLWSEVPCYILSTNGAGTHVNALNGVPFDANTPYWIPVGGDNLNVSMTSIVGAGNLYLTPTTR